MSYDDGSLSAVLVLEVLRFIRVFDDFMGFLKVLFFIWGFNVFKGLVI